MNVTDAVRVVADTTTNTSPAGGTAAVQVAPTRFRSAEGRKTTSGASPCTRSPASAAFRAALAIASPTHAELADRIGLSRFTLTGYAVGRRRTPESVARVTAAAVRAQALELLAAADRLEECADADAQRANA